MLKTGPGEGGETLPRETLISRCLIDEILPLYEDGLPEALRGPTSLTECFIFSDRGAQSAVRRERQSEGNRMGLVVPETKISRGSEKDAIAVHGDQQVDECLFFFAQGFAIDKAPVALVKPQRVLTVQDCSRGPVPAQRLELGKVVSIDLQ